jgi:SAM-dependent methyltransferase
VATPPNAAQAERWGGAGGCHWIEHEGAYDRQLEPFGVALLTGAALEPHERVLDVGCGTGTTALTAAATADRVLGIDLSAVLVERARARAEGRRNVEFQVADAQTAQLPDPFDVVISRFGVMFFDDPPAAFANLRRAVAPSGGRLAAVCWQGLEHNDWMRVPAEALARVTPVGDLARRDQPGPFSLADPDALRSVLTDSGWRDVTLDAVTTPVVLAAGGSLDEVVAIVRGGSLGRSALSGVPADVERRALDAVRDALAGFVGPDGLSLPGAAWLVRATVPARARAGAADAAG